MINGIIGAVLMNLVGFFIIWCMWCLFEWRRVPVTHIRHWASVARLGAFIAFAEFTLLGYAIGSAI